MGFRNWLMDKFTAWLVHEYARPEPPMSDFERLAQEARPCDVLLVEGRSRVGAIIKNITQTIWTHSALCIGRLRDMDPTLRALVEPHLESPLRGDPDQQLIIEALLGEGTLVKPLSKYCGEHLRICRPHHLTAADSRHIMEFAARHLGNDYDFRQLVDLGRFMLPFRLLPRRWRSTLFEYHAGIATRTVCSSMIAAAFAGVHYPVMPAVRRDHDGQLRLFKRNPRLHTPRDFDTSPYFDIIKYPLLGVEEPAGYRRLPWSRDGMVCNDANDCFIPPAEDAVSEEPPPEKVVLLQKKKGYL